MKETKAGLFRRIKAQCYSCSPDLVASQDCQCPCCPFYDLRAGNTGDQIDWFTLPISQWKEAEHSARMGKPLPKAKKTVRTEAQKEAWKQTVAERHK